MSVIDDLKKPQRSIVTEASAILAEEAQSFASESASRLSTLIGAGAPIGLVPGANVPEQARQLVDALTRLAAQGPDAIARLLTRSTEGQGGDTAQAIRVLQALRPVQAGDVAHVPLRLVNDDTETDECVLAATDLIGISGHRIPASHVRVLPSLARIPAGESTEVRIEVRVPSATPAGRYAGLLQTDDGEALRALVIVTVAQ